MERILQYIDGQLDAILQTPAMWGSPQCVELQVLQLLEFRAVTLGFYEETLVQDAYDTFLASRFQNPSPVSLSALVGHQMDNLVKFLSEFRNEFVGDF